MKAIKATIYFTIDKKHPDYGYVTGGYKKGQILSFTDTYVFGDVGYSLQDMKNYIKKDLSIVAGGGYNAEHVHNKKFKFEIIERN